MTRTRLAFAAFLFGAVLSSRCSAYLKSFHKPADDPVSVSMAELQRCLDVPCGIQWGSRMVVPANVPDAALICLQPEGAGIQPACIEVRELRHVIFDRRKAH